MDESHENGLSETDGKGKNDDYKCKFCEHAFDDMQSVLKHELLKHTLRKNSKPNTPANKLKRKLTAVRKNITEDEKNSRQTLYEAIFSCAKGSELSVIIKQFQIDNKYRTYIFHRVQACLEETLNKLGDFSIEVFGSFANGLALKSSDIDLHVFPRLQHGNPKALFRDVAKAVYRNHHFTNIFPIHHAKVPIIKCVHKETGFSLDINTSEPYGVHNSRFIRQLNESDPRIHQLMLFLKIWCKSMQISGTCGMTNYCLIGLIIFYLQNNNPPLLHSIKILQRNIPKRVVNGINFQVNLRGIPIDGSQSVDTYDLIKGFFDFYQSFNFEDCIIAPYLGKTIKRKDFENKVYLYPEYEEMIRVLAKDGVVEELKTDRPMCIQDIFCLNINVGKSLSEINMQYFQKCLCLAYKKCSEPSLSKKELYKYLLLDLIYDVTQMRLHKEPDFSKSETRMSFDIIPRRNELKSLSKLESDPQLGQKLWVKEYIYAIVQIITEVYKVDMTMLSSTQSLKMKKIDMKDDNTTPVPVNCSISCYVDLWTGRQIQRGNTSFMEYHLKQTEQLYATRCRDSNFAVQLKGHLSIHIIGDYNAIRVELSGPNNISRKDKLRKFFNAFKSLMENYNLKERIYQLETRMEE